MKRDFLRTILALAILIGFMWIVRRILGPAIAGDEQSTLEQIDQLGLPFESLGSGLLHTAASVGLMLLGAFLAGRLFQRLGLSAVSGYLLIGVLVGPHALELIDDSEEVYLSLVNDLAVALIALTAGGEIRLSFLRHAWKRVLGIAGSAVGGVMLGAFALLLALLPLAGVVSEALTTTAIVLAAMGAVVAAANSPAIVIAIITESHARGDISRTALAVTVCKDLILVILFTVVMAVGVNSLDTAGAEQGPVFVPLATHLGGSMLAGIGVGVVMALYMHLVRANLAFFVLLGCFGIALLSENLHLETLIVAVFAGMLLENVWPDEAEPLFEQIEELSLPTYCVFFAVAGVKVDLGAVADMWIWALLFVALRALLVWLVTTGACRLTRAEPATTRWLWTALIPQAGIALALVAIIDEKLTEAGIDATAMISFLVTVIAAHQLLGPVLFKLALGWSGESGAGGAPAERQPEPNPSP